MTKDQPTSEIKIEELDEELDLAEDSAEDEEEDEGSGALRQNLTWAISLVLVFLLGLGSGYLLWARPLQERVAAYEQILAQNATAAAQQQQAAAQNQNAQQQDVRRYPVPVDDDPVLGPADAPITIIEFSDYECPFCQRWHLEVFPQLKARYGDQIRFVYRDFPLYSIHPNAGPAAEAANCAGDQDRYWEFNDRLFSGQRPMNRDTYLAYAQELDLEMGAFTACVDDRRYEKEVEADYIYASELGVRSTPTFFINGLAVVGAQPFEVFEQIIELELAGEIP